MSGGDVTDGVLPDGRREGVARIYRALSKIDEGIVRLRQRDPLFQHVCRALVVWGRLRMAWVGEVDVQGSIVPVAHAGAVHGYLDAVRHSMLDVPEGRGPIGTAARERRHVFTTDIASDELMAPWRDAALARGYRSSAALALVIEDRCVAVLTVYSSEPGFFDEQAMGLFDRMAADVSVALEAIRREEQRRAVEAELRASEERFRVAAESMLDSLTIISPVRDDHGEIVDFRYEYVNDAYCTLVGFAREQLLGRRLGELFSQFPGSDRFAVYRQVAATRQPCRSDAVHGEEAWAGTALATRVLDITVASMGEDLVVSARDITERKHDEQELTQTAAMLERTQEISNTAGWEYDVTAGKTTWTDEVYRIVGLERSSDPLDPAKAIAAYDAESAPAIGAAFERLIADGEPFDLELGLIRADRQRIWVRVIGRPVVEDGRVVRVNGAIADITERKRSAQQRERALAELQEAEQIARLGSWHWDPAAGTRSWSAGMYQLYGRDPAGGPIGTEESFTWVHPDDRERVRGAYARMLEGGERLELDHRLLTGDRGMRTVHAIARPDPDQPGSYRGTVQDVTALREAEEELAETTGLLERTQEISKTGGWEYDLATGKLTWTDEVYRIYGSDRGCPVELERALSAFDPEGAPIITAALARLVADGEPCDLEVRLIRADRQRIWARVVGQAVIEGGRVVRVRGIIADVTDRKLVEEELRTLNAELEQRVAVRTVDLERVNRELESFAYSVSHDLRAPLRAVDGFSKALLDDYAQRLDEDGRHYLERVRAAAVRMGNLIDEILQLSRLSRRRFERVPVDMSALAREIVADLNDAEPDREVEVEIEDGLQAEADLGLVRSVLQNLLANAYKFTSKTARPLISFGAVEQDGVPVYFVSDNGAGFDMTHGKGLFRPFHRLHRESEFPGDGIGLATAARAVHRHGGVIWAQGIVDQGATFHFSLTPRAHPPASAATAGDVIPAWQPTDGDERR